MRAGGKCLTNIPAGSLEAGSSKKRAPLYKNRRLQATWSCQNKIFRLSNPRASSNLGAIALVLISTGLFLFTTKKKKETLTRNLALSNYLVFASFLLLAHFLFYYNNKYENNP